MVNSYPSMSSGDSKTMTNGSRTLDGRVLLPLLLGATAACGGEGAFDAWCNTPGREITLLLFYALPPGVLAAAVAGWARKRQLDGWDLRESAGVPSSWLTVGTFLALFFVAGLVFSFALNDAEGCHPEQRTTNLWFAWVGIVLAAVLCLLGPFGANWLYTRR